jgi:hypothetical protein
VLRRMFGPKRDEVTEGGRKLHNEEPSILRTIKSRKMQLAGHVARMSRRGTCKGYWWGSQR